MATKRAARRRPARRANIDIRVELAAIMAKCAQNASRIERLESEYATQVRRCAELQGEIDRIKNERAFRPDR